MTEPRPRFSSREEFQRLALATGDDYWRATWDVRWPYIDGALAIIEEIRPRAVLEIGSAGLPLMVGGDVMDVDPRFEPTICHDAASVPWPCRDGEYDVVVALQVFEHLRGYQQIVFDEVRRVSRGAVLSLPYRWLHGDQDHRRIDRSVIDWWTKHEPPVASYVYVGDRGVHKGVRRILLHYDFQWSRDERHRRATRERRRRLTASARRAR